MAKKEVKKQIQSKLPHVIGAVVFLVFGWAFWSMTQENYKGLSVQEIDAVGKPYTRGYAVGLNEGRQNVLTEIQKFVKENGHLQLGEDKFIPESSCPEPTVE